jgi:hypothetical protein
MTIKSYLNSIPNQHAAYGLTHGSEDQMVSLRIWPQAGPRQISCARNVQGRCRPVYV